MVDTMLAGRFILGIGPGGLRSDAEMMETLDADRNAIFLEAIEHMIALWTRRPPYRLLGKRWRLTTERRPARHRHGRCRIPEAVPADRRHGHPAPFERHRRRRGRGWAPISANFVIPGW